MKELSKSDRTDIKNLLDIKVEGMGDLDILQDEDTYSVESSSMRNALQFKKDKIPAFIPTGQKGRDVVAKIPAVARIEQKLRGNLEVLPDGIPLKQQLTQLSVKQRNQDYIQGLQVIGKPVDGVIRLQPAATDLARDLHILDGMILTIITAISLFVILLPAEVWIRFNSRANPTPATS